MASEDEEHPENQLVQLPWTQHQQLTSSFTSSVRQMSRWAAAQLQQRTQCVKMSHDLRSSCSIKEQICDLRCLNDQHGLDYHFAISKIEMISYIAFCCCIYCPTSFIHFTVFYVEALKLFFYCKFVFFCCPFSLILCSWLLTQICSFSANRHVYLSHQICFL